MLTENDVIGAVCDELREHDYEIIQRRSTTEHGDDIIAAKRGLTTRKLCIEAKGETSSKPHTKRYGKQFGSDQIPEHVAGALYKAAVTLSKKDKKAEIRAGIAFPDTENHRACVKDIQPVLDKLEVAVFWVNEDRSVETVSVWPLTD